MCLHRVEVQGSDLVANVREKADAVRDNLYDIFERREKREKSSKKGLQLMGSFRSKLPMGRLYVPHSGG